uniref:U34-Deinotoxin-Dsu1bo_1 n=1 Tax=Deinopis subrufa TaxID=1905329 RepID=A0A4Q8KCG4_DEISU
MKLLLPILVIYAVLVIANAELEEFSENAPAPYGPEAVEERACVGKWGKCNDNADCCKGMSCKCYHVGWFKHECECKK